MRAWAGVGGTYLHRRKSYKEKIMYINISHLHAGPNVVRHLRYTLSEGEDASTPLHLAALEYFEKSTNARLTIGRNNRNTFISYKCNIFTKICVD